MKTKASSSEKTMLTILLFLASEINLQVKKAQSIIPLEQYDCQIFPKFIIIIIKNNIAHIINKTPLLMQNHSYFYFDTFMKTSSSVLWLTDQALIAFFISYSSRPIDYLLYNLRTKPNKSLQSLTPMIKLPPRQSTKRIFGNNFWILPTTLFQS